MIRLTPVVLNDKKNAFFVINLIKIYRNHSFTKIWMEIWYTCNLCVIWQYCPCDMYIHLQTIGLIGVTELGTVTCHFAPNQSRFHWSISRWILLRRKNIFGKSLKSSLSLFVLSFRFFYIFKKHDIAVLVSISHGNRSLTSYGMETIWEIYIWEKKCDTEKIRAPGWHPETFHAVVSADGAVDGLLSALHMATLLNDKPEQWLYSSHRNQIDTFVVSVR